MNPEKITGIFDTHSHYDDKRFNADREQTLEKVRNAGVELILNCGADVRSSQRAFELTKKYDFIYATAGVHPHYASQADDEAMKVIESLLQNKKVVGVGEAGLDYFRNLSPKEDQKAVFEKHIHLAKKYKLPLIIHDRDAHQDICDMVKALSAKDTGGIIHCFSGKTDMARFMLSNNFYIAVGGTLTYNNAVHLPEVVKYVPMDMLLIETDCPYLSPEPFRNGRNDSGYLVYVIEKIAQIKGISPQSVADITMENGKKLFGIS